MNIENDPIVDSNGNTIKDYLLSGELPPVTFKKKEYRICNLYEDLGPLQPNLETLVDGEWVKSAIITGRVSRGVMGRYRVPL
jgi:hypothetical protein